MSNKVILMTYEVFLADGSMIPAVAYPTSARECQASGLRTTVPPVDRRRSTAVRGSPWPPWVDDRDHSAAVKLLKF